MLCLLKGECGAERVIASLPQAWVSAVSLSEVYAKLTDVGGTEARIAQAIGSLHLRIDAFDDAHARAVGMLHPLIKTLGLSLGAQACLALARQREATALTTDRVWTELPETLGIAIELIA